MDATKRDKTEKDKTEKDNVKKNMLLTLFLWCLLCGGCMAAMLAVAANKTIVIADAAEETLVQAGEKAQAGSGLAGEKAQSGNGQAGEKAQSGKELNGAQAQAAAMSGTALDVQKDSATPGTALDIQQDASLKNQLCIPLKKGTKAEQVTMENRYLEQELWIYIENAEESFYRQNPITGDSTHIGQCRYEATEDGLLIKMQMEAVWEYYSTMENDSLKIALLSPRESFQQIVVLDPVGVVDTDVMQDCTLQVAKLVLKKVNQPGVKIYLTCNEDGDVPEELKKRLVQEVEPDLFLQIGVLEEAEDAEQYGIAAYYNEEYYIPDFGNVEWADTVTRKVTVAASNRALGLFPAKEDSILRQLNMPAAEICLGYLTNARENALLSQESYQEKLAEGIAEAILEVYTNTYTQK